MERQAFTWIAGRVITQRSMAARLCHDGAKRVAGGAPKNDLTKNEALALNATARIPVMRLWVRVWWWLYDYYRKKGAIPSAQEEAQNGNPWLP